MLNFTGYTVQADKQGANIADVNVEQFKRCLQQFHLVVLRGFQILSKAELVSFAQSFGPLLAWAFGEVMEMKVQEKPTNYLFTEGDVPLHWDGAFYKVPKYLLFHCVEAPLPGAGGETLFVNTENIWAESTPAEKKQWQDLKLHFQTEKLAHYGGEFSQRLVEVHPDTGKTILRFAEPVPATYLNPVTVYVEDKSDLESKEIIASLRKRFYESHYQYVHTWLPNDILIADNYSLVHGRNKFLAFSPRHLRRIQIL